MGLSKLKSGRNCFRVDIDREIIIPCVHWYLRYKLGLRDLVEMMAERGCHAALKSRFTLVFFNPFRDLPALSLH
jgi:hypothetical protein